MIRPIAALGLIVASVPASAQDYPTRVIDSVGADHVLYGSDAPPLTSLKPRAIKLVEDLKISEDDRAKIFWRNAAKLLKIEMPNLARSVA